MPLCAGNIRKTTEEYKQNVYNLVGDEYNVLGEYINNKTKIKMFHNICKKPVFIAPSDFLSGRRCSECQSKIAGMKLKNTYEEVKEYVESFDGYILLSDTYIDAKEKLRIKCPKGHIFNPSYNSFKNGSRCPKCNESKGEKKISDYLDINNVIHLPQYKFKNCKNKRPLPFDEAVFDDYGNLLFLIEYDGEQHYRPWNAFGKERGEKKFKIIQHHDSIKTNYCIANNIKLVRIPYWDFNNIETILTKELSFLLGGDYQREVMM